MEIYIERLKTFSADIVSAVNSLLAQLNPASEPLIDEHVKEIIETSSNYFLVARESVSHKIVGMLTLVVYRIPVWKKAWIEDLVVDKEYRGKGIATKLINHAIENAKTNRVLSSSRVEL